jgi:hypothetical protein
MNDIPYKYMNIWNKLKADCESDSENNKYIVEMIIQYCKLPTNKILSYSESGFIGNNKKIRFRKKTSIYEKKDNDIVIDHIINTNSDSWTYEELDDIIYGFIQTVIYHTKCKYITGHIEMKNIDILNNTYLVDSDSESD